MLSWLTAILSEWITPHTKESQTKVKVVNLCHYRRTDDRYSYLTQSQSTIMEMMVSYRLWSQADQHKEKWARPDWARPDWARPDCIFMVV